MPASASPPAEKVMQAVAWSGAPVICLPQPVHSIAAVSLVMPATYNTTCNDTQDSHSALQQNLPAAVCYASCCGTPHASACAAGSALQTQPATCSRRLLAHAVCGAKPAPTARASSRAAAALAAARLLQRSQPEADH
jgi:hypothetical protein